LSAHADFAAAMDTLRNTGKTRFAFEITIGDVARPVARFTGRYAVRKRTTH